MNLELVGIDPGTTHSGHVALDAAGHVKLAGIVRNETLLDQLHAGLLRDAPLLAIEWVSSYGMPVGREVFETCRWVGRFQQAWHAPDAVMLVTRAEVKLQLCHSARAKDANIRQALIDLHQPTGGGAVPQIGTARKRGPLYGVHSHAWSALAVAVVASARTAAARRQRVPAFMGETALERIA